MTVLEARHIEYRRSGQTILDDVSLTVGPGERLAVTGPSGSGKTSLLAVLAGLLAPTGGTVHLDGRPIGPPAGAGPDVGVVLQGYGLVSLLTAAENVEIALRAAGTAAGNARTASASALAAVGLTHQAGQLVEELSGGQQQRVAVARALALQPRILIADEPTAEQDPASRALVLARLLDVAADGGALVLATHDPEVAARCDRTLDLTVNDGARPVR